MKQLSYTIEDSTIAEVLGVQNFSNDESAVLELIKNAYDAEANNLLIKINKDELIIFDDGVGMNFVDIEKHWMHVGKSDKEYCITDSNQKFRVLAGSKGVGRFALSRLGAKATIISHKANNDAVRWTTDWNESYIENIDVDFEHGTKIIISALREKWTKIKVKNLVDFISKTYNDDVMKISFESDEYSGEINRYFPIAEIGKNCLSAIDLKYDANNLKLHVEINSDEFIDEAKQYCKSIDINHYSTTLNIVDELITSKDIEIAFDLSDVTELTKLSHQLGSFCSSMLFNINISLSEKEKFLYKHYKLNEKVGSGVILYRNAFSISSYEGKKDWLGLSKRARKSPAAATHESGSWRVRDNQLLGKVEIDKKENAVLKDLSNRQGLEENIYFQLFVAIIHIGLKQFERYRQSIIRNINKKNKKNEKKNGSITAKILKNNSLLDSLNETEKKEFINELKQVKKEQKYFRIEQQDQESKYKYDVRILNVLSTSGLKAASIAHEMDGDRNAISEFTSNIIEALKEYQVWDTLNETDKTQVAYKNVPLLIEKNDKNNKKILVFMDTMLSEIEKQQFECKYQSVYDILSEIKTTWERDYSWITIALNSQQEDIVFNVAQDMVKVIFDNLILNSIQQNPKSNHLDLSISVIQDGDLLVFDYSDNGVGLIDKYKTDPRRILEVHESSRKDGHGLGMWIVNNTAVMSGGEVIDISGDKGFNIRFSLGGNV